MQLKVPNIDLTRLYELIHKDRAESFGLLFDGLAHELGNPLSTIRGRAELLADKLESQHRRGLEIIIEEVDRMAAIIDSLRNLKAGSQELNKENCSLKTQVEAVLLIFKQRCVRSQISVEVQIDPKMMVHVEPSRLQQILMSLFLNSIEAMEKDSYGIKKDKLRSIIIHAHQRNRVVDLVISDTGKGMSEEVSRRAFQPFYTTKEVGEGTGLGLYIAQRMSEEIGAKLTFFSREGVGTTFEIQIPAGV